MEYKQISKCICCESGRLKLILDLNEQPLANSYHELEIKLSTYPLKLNLCLDCFHLQLSHVVSPDLLFKDYLYVSGTTLTLKQYFSWFARFVTKYSKKESGKILDIACNDGTQLDFFKDLGWDTYGIDPAENLYQLSAIKHNVVCDYFDQGKLGNQTFDIITAQNVFAHNENAKKFLDDCETIMDESSLLFIQTSQAEMIKQNQFDTIYHEHISFFNINSMNELLNRTNLNLIDVIKSPVHGISYIFIIGKKSINNELIQNLIDVEKEYGLLSESTYDTYQLNALNIVDSFKHTIDLYRNKGYKIIGYGAAAKGMTFLNFANTKLDYIIDDNPLKQNLYTPGTNIQIKSIDFIKTYSESDSILFIPLAWNFYKEIKSRISSVRLNKNDRYLKYFPIQSIEE